MHDDEIHKAQVWVRKHLVALVEMPSASTYENAVADSLRPLAGVLPEWTVPEDPPRARIDGDVVWGLGSQDDRGLLLAALLDLSLRAGAVVDGRPRFRPRENWLHDHHFPRLWQCSPDDLDAGRDRHVMTLPTDSHVHSEWSWDAPDGSMRRSCEQALRLGIGSIAFTEHLDYTVWRPTAAELALGDYPPDIAEGGSITPPGFDTVGYHAAVQECRERYPQLRILSGLELGEPHWHTSAVREVLSAGPFDRVLGSLHCLADRGGYAEPDGLFEYRDAREVIRSYLAEVAVLVSSAAPFDVLAHIDYPVRDWPAAAGLFDPRDFEDEFRHALRLTAESGRALEINTVVPLGGHILGWWHEEGGQAVTFGSDAHEPETVARGFGDAVALAAAHGFRPGPDPYDFWGRQG